MRAWGKPQEFLRIRTSEIQCENDFSSIITNLIAPTSAALLGTVHTVVARSYTASAHRLATHNSFLCCKAIYTSFITLLDYSK